MHKLFFACLLILCCGPLGFAQSDDSSPVEFFAGYSVMPNKYGVEITAPQMPDYETTSQVSKLAESRPVSVSRSFEVKNG